jgi:hypothetical protein
MPGAVLWPVQGLPFGLPVSVVMIVIPAIAAALASTHQRFSANLPMDR